MDCGRTGFSESSSILSCNSLLHRLPSSKRLDAVNCNKGCITPSDKTPLLSLRLSSSSFLQTVVEDETRLALYTIKTTGNLTTIMRSDPREGMTKTADIRWPERFAVTKGKGKKSDGVQLQMRGQRWVDREALLRTGSGPSAHHKFSIPNYSHSLKWRQVGASYWCTSPSVQGPIAVLEPAQASSAPHLQIFETFHDKYDRNRISDHQGVSILLLDYILITALLLVTDVQEWMLAKKVDPHIDHTEHSSTEIYSADDASSTTGFAVTSTSQWRKIMYGEPIYPKRHARSNSSLSPTLSDKLAKVMHGKPMYPKLSSMINFDSSSDSDPEEEPISSPELLGPTTLAPGPTIYSAANASSSSHPDPDLDCCAESTYEATHHRLTNLPPSISSQTSASPTTSPSHYETRVAPMPYFSRPRSTPPLARLAQDNHPPLPPTPSTSRNVRSPSLPTNLINRHNSSGRPSRPLPRPPEGPQPLRQTQSQQGLDQPGSPDKYSPYSSRTLPNRPLRPSLSVNAHSLPPVVDAGPVTASRSYPSQPLYCSPVASQYLQFRSPYPRTPLLHHQKTPDENESVHWMGTSCIPESEGPTSAPPYDVPPPAYNTINFDE